MNNDNNTKQQRTVRLAVERFLLVKTLTAPIGLSWKSANIKEHMCKENITI